MPMPIRFITAIGISFCAGALALGCAGYEGAVRELRSSLIAGDKERALEMANRALEVNKDDAYPEKIKGDKALLLLERASVKQGLGRFESSSADFRMSEKHLELLDLKNDTMGNIGKFLFSDDATIYKAPAYEKLLLNTFNMLNYLAEGDLEGARVEARRLRVIQDYLAGEKSEQATLLGMGNYLAGFTFEMSGQAEQALAYYSAALENEAYPSATEPIRRLTGCTGFRTDKLRQVLAEPEAPGAETAETAEGDADAGVAPSPVTPECLPRPLDKGTLLVVTGIGLAPYKVARRIPIGAAIVIAGALLGAMESAQAQRLAAKGLLTWINFPTLEKSKERYTRTRTSVDGAPQPTDLGLDVTEKVIRAWDSIKGVLMVAAITRLVTRLIAGEATERAVKQAGGGGIGSLLAGLAVQGALTAADTPDTRSWVTLPSRVYFSRTELQAGRHDVEIVFEGSAGRTVIDRTIEVPAGGFVVLPLASMR